jgi:hypothetical protein
MKTLTSPVPAGSRVAFFARPKESHIKKGPFKRRLSPYEDVRLTGAGDHRQRQTRTVGAASAAFANGGG